METGKAGEKEAAPKVIIGVEELPLGIVHVKFSSQEALAKTFLRFEEHFESPHFRGKVFTFDEFKAWYAARRGVFDYYEEWDGFNIPSKALKDFYEGKFNPLSAEEKEFLELFKDRREKFYIIGTVGDDSTDTFKHEAAHALFYLDKQYRREVLKVMAKLRSKELNEHLLNELSYHRAVLEDERHAYLLAELGYLESEGFDVSKFREVHEKLSDLYNKFSPFQHHAKGR
ncbi:MAG TPA: ABC transporter ATP-binding protein [archaeon]|nr:ABC transporter ATP-binding protein [archaeon]